MFETFGFENLTAGQAALWFALALGLAFGVLAQITRFCFRRMIDGDDRRKAAGVWLTALAVAVLGTQGAVAQDWISFANHRFMADGLPVLAIGLGGLMFGAGMILTRGCISRLTVLTGTGNLRAALVLVVFAVVAHATLKGVLAPVRTGLGSVTLDVTPALPGSGLLWAGVIALAALAYAWRSGNRPVTLALAAGLGALVPLGWVGTGFVLFDDFDPIAMESLSFTAPATEALFFTVASTAVAPGFGTGLVGGVLLGALAAALVRRQFRWQSFESPRQTGRYMAGAALMGLGGVLAGGCTVGAGLSGVPTLSLAALLAIAAIGLGGWLTRAALNAMSVASAGSATRQAALPAE
ncbi:YeeE/YedE family protein [Lutimaribacter sp. EGI FJ00015]|uniref:YeeE/YedE family protein n=1 Tax=Lutimaribacter degradans TaxID=2945989 RepID=A0ACC5ZTF1_9RHOB|nr:YeeE/YedE thiosulfate transporter family protein [Lutimaribacter sp. EGI FJ00013]MCM2560829.1 YeeE/YedE family protein [Lutimaribacter sp. EGI FJ00013]MCO0612226.1 YeeE/YedE family protein [Lutimaribacter sp. EGI FJ00015]MCO0634654.1 YeeE/YedE family protein [Lutimaribacter sp. EGI FJ00014]